MPSGTQTGSLPPLGAVTWTSTSPLRTLNRAGDSLQLDATTANTGPITFSIVSGTLPTGLTLSQTGVLSGSTTTNISATVTIRATDGDGISADRSFLVRTSAAPVWQNDLSLLTAIPINTARTYTLSATEPDGESVSFAVAGGALPTGLTLSGNAVTGTATTAGTGSVTLRALDVNGVFSDRTFTWGVGNNAEFTFTGAVQSMVVPDGVTSINVAMWDAGGGAIISNVGVGGAGGAAFGRITVSPGDVVQVYVGGGGTGSDNGRAAGGGGGSSAVVVNGTLMMVAGGGGGSAGTSTRAGGAGGGSAGERLGCGGNGGTQTGPGAGTSCGRRGGASGSGANGGGGATGSVYSAGGWGWGTGGAGDLNVNDAGSGGGGGGYFGGGQGGGDMGGFGGGGGSGYIHPSVQNGSLAAGAQTVPGASTDVRRPASVGLGGQTATNVRANARGGHGYVLLSY